MSDYIQKAKDLLFGMAYTESDGEELIAMVTELTARAEAAELKAAGLDQVIEMYKKMLRSKDIIINQQENRITELAEKLLKIAGK